MTLYTTALAAVHEAAGAKMVPFAGWLMPLRYTSDIAEHQAVRGGAGLFDLSHMAQLEVSGPDAGCALDQALVGVYSQMRVGKAKYSMMVESDGGVIDDLIVYRLAENEYLVIANAANREVVRDELVARSAGMDVQVIDHTAVRVMLAVQGPKAAGIVGALSPADLGALKYYSIVSTTAAGIPVLLARTGYTGEDGFEIIAPAESARALWDAIISHEVTLCGLAARDTLRLEAGMPLYGHELSRSITPFEAGLGRVVNLDHWFVGRDALALRTQPDRTLVGLTGDGRRAARAGAQLRWQDEVVGEVTSGVLSPTLGHPIALAYLALPASTVGTAVVADVRGTALPMTVVSLPFYHR